MLGQVIRAERRQRGWSQDQLAERSGLAQTYISALERGQYDNPSIEALRGLARAFEVSVDALLQATELTVQPPAVDELEQMLQEIEQLGASSTTVAAYRRMGHLLITPADRETVLVAVRGLRDVLLQQIPAHGEEEQPAEDAGDQTRRSA